MKNYELIYKVRAGRYNTNSKINLRNQYKNEAERKADAEHQKYLDFLKKELGHENFEVTNIACMADGVLGHVYASEKPEQKGLGKRVCVFCGCDNFDD